MLRFRHAAASHPGLVRDINEDAGYASDLLLVVADGVSGAPAGEVASASTTYVVSSVAMTTDSEPLTVLAQAVEFSCQHLQAAAEYDRSRQGMATTLTVVLTDGHRFGLAHLGDSRGFLLRGSRLNRSPPTTHCCN